jgi:predicted phage terminase large subunit-like protein
LLALVTEGKAVEADLVRLEDLLDELERVERIHKGEHNVLYYGMTYFSEDGNPGNPDNLIPAGVNVLNSAKFHQMLCGLFDDISKGVQTRNVAWAVPRQHAKTAWISNIFLTHQIVYRKRKYIVLFSETTDVAGDFISWGKFQLKLNEKLREDFGELLHVKPSMNELDNKYEFITTSNTKVEAKGLATQTRGLRHGNTRPDMFILDDLESSDSTNTPELIEKSKKWFREEMLPAMSKQGICVYLGTILCYGSLLHYVLEERRDFESRKMSAIDSYASNEELWEQWRKIYRSDVKNAADKARQFYEDNEEAMLAGTDILWPEFWSYYEFMVIREESGIKAFNQEYQNNPTDEERQIFKPEYFQRFIRDDLFEANLRFYGAIDFAMGKEAGDYSAIVTLAKNLDTGRCYIWDVYMARVHPDVLLKKAVELTLKYQYDALGVEAQMAQEWFADKLGEELQRQGYPSHTRLKKIKQRTRKSLRIEALLPDIQNGSLRFVNDLEMNAMEQFEMYPMHRHDDFPDAVSMAYSTAKQGNAVVRTTRKRMR